MCDSRPERGGAVPIRITCAPPAWAAPVGCIAASAWALAAGRVEPSLYSSGAPSGALASAEAASAAGQSCSSTSTTACGRVPVVRPGYTARATAAASVAGSEPPSRVVFFVARPAAPWVLTWAIGPPEPHRQRTAGRGLAAARERRAGEHGHKQGSGEVHVRTLPVLQRRKRCWRVTRHGAVAQKRAGTELAAKPGICGINLRNEVQPVQASLHFASLPPERRILDQMSGNGGPKLLGRIPRCIREKRRLFQR